MELARFERAIRSLLHEPSRPAAPRQIPTNPRRTVGSKVAAGTLHLLEDIESHRCSSCQPKLTRGAISPAPVPVALDTFGSTVVGPHASRAGHRQVVIIRALQCGAGTATPLLLGNRRQVSRVITARFDADSVQPDVSVVLLVARTTEGAVILGVVGPCSCYTVLVDSSKHSLGGRNQSPVGCLRSAEAAMLIARRSSAATYLLVRTHVRNAHRLEPTPFRELGGTFRCARSRLLARHVFARTASIRVYMPALGLAAFRATAAERCVSVDRAML